MENEKKQASTKGAVKGFVIIGLIVFSVIILISCIGCGNNEAKQTNDEYTQKIENAFQNVLERREKYIQDSTSLINYIYDNSNIGKQKDINRIVIEELNLLHCQVGVEITKESGKWDGINALGEYVCKLAVKWLVENSFDLKDMSIICAVYSPHIGVSGREGMILLYGHSVYNYNSDSIDWEPYYGE